MSSKTVLETLEAARRLIELPEHWTQGVYARDYQGRVVEQSDPSAVCWCMDGAIGFAEGSPTCGGRVGGAWSSLRKAVVGNITEFNDTHTHAEVLLALDAAIAKEREAQHVL